MVVTVTMNPAIDKTVEIDTLIPGGLNRIHKVEYDAGGKGINVSKTIQELGGKSIATGFLGGNVGKTVENMLNEKNIQNDFIWVDSETRTNTKIFEQNGEVTELNEPGPEISEEQTEQLLKKLETLAGKDTLFVLSGSVPRGVDKDIYGRITRRVHKKGSKVLVDADGELFTKALDASPDMIKPNRVELEEYAKLNYRASQEELFGLAEKLMKKGIGTVVVSMGKSGALFVMGEKRMRCPALSVKAHSTVGAGDAMVAALCLSWNQKLDATETVKLCMAASAGAVTTIGTKPPAKELLEELIKQVEINEE